MFTWWRSSALVVLMAATDDELQKLGRPPIYSGKEDEWNEWSFVMRSYVSLLSAHIPALLAGAEDATNPDMGMMRIRATLTDDGVAAAQKLIHVLVMNVREPALAVIRGITDMSGALAWRALITRYAPNTAPRVQSLMSAILNVKDLPLRAHSLRDCPTRVAREHSQVGNGCWRSCQRVNEEGYLL